MALVKIDREGYPDNRDSKKYVLIQGTKTYPPKYVLSIANHFANGEELDRTLFSGGEETNNFLRTLGFNIAEKVESVSSFSWTMINSNTAYKKFDKSLFLHNGTGVPIDIRSFFHLTEVQPGGRKELDLRLNNELYKAVIEMDKQKNPRTRLLWKSDFATKLRALYPDVYEAFQNTANHPQQYPDMIFLKRNESEYDIFFADAIQFGAVYSDIEADKAENEEFIKEGNVKYYYGKRYERNPKNRQRAIEIHGCFCSVCNFDFERMYGEFGKNFIEVHHIKPLHEFKGEEVDVNPETDLIPICSNCHRIIHRDVQHLLTVKELRGIIAKIKQQ
jgi:5-methylcytosine-specific restriction protein A